MRIVLDCYSPGQSIQRMSSAHGFGHGHPIAKIIKTAKTDPKTPFLVPCSAVGTYGLACVRPSVRPFVCSAEISKSVHRNFLFFGTKLGLPNATEVTFSDFARKTPFGRFWPVLVKNGHFWPKINVSANFSKFVHRIFLILHI